MASPATSRGSGHSKAHFPANHRIPQVLDVFRGEKIRGRIAERLPSGPVLMARAAAFMDVAAVAAVIVAAMAAAEVVDRLSGEGFRGESGPRYDGLAVFISVSGICGLETGHVL